MNVLYLENVDPLAVYNWLLCKLKSTSGKIEKIDGNTFWKVSDSLSEWTVWQSSDNSVTNSSELIFNGHLPGCDGFRAMNYAELIVDTFENGIVITEDFGGYIDQPSDPYTWARVTTSKIESIVEDETEDGEPCFNESYTKVIKERKHA